MCAMPSHAIVRSRLRQDRRPFTPAGYARRLSAPAECDLRRSGVQLLPIDAIVRYEPHLLKSYKYP
jgi:hypothetical protein